jgi:hypothetical protein
VTVTAGTSGNLKALAVNGTDVVYIIGTVTLNSYTKITGNCTTGSYSAYGTCGFSIGNTSSPASNKCVVLAANATTVSISNNSLYACGGYMISEPTGSTTDQIYIGGNTLSYSCSTSASPDVCTAIQINGNHQLIENNDFSHLSDGPYLNGEWIVLRNNTMHDIETTDCGTNSGNCHIDFMQADGSGGPDAAGLLQFIMLERNTTTNMLMNGGSVGGSAVHGIGLFQNVANDSSHKNGIVRFGTVSHIDGGGLFDDTNNWANLKVYNNSYVDITRHVNASGELFNSFTAGINSTDINDLFYFTVPLTGFANSACESTTCSTFTYGHSLAWCTSSGCNTIYSHTYGSGVWTNDAGNLISDPLFASYSTNNFSLTPGSPALNTGTALTTVASGDSGSGTSLIVNDASYLQDGWGITGVNADCISVTRVSNHVCVTAVNYQTNTLTLAASITRSAGDRLWLYSDSTGRPVLIGSAPNIGATFASAAVTAPPTGLTAVVR